MHFTKSAMSILAVLLLPCLVRAEGREAVVLQEAMVKIIEKAEPSIACILVSRSDDNKLDLAHPDQAPEAFGSGAVIDKSGLVLTSYHVLRQAKKIYVRLPGNRGSYAEIWAAESRCDLAVLKMSKPPADLQAIKIGEGDKVRKGQWLIQLANPYAAGFRDGSPSASVGIVSNLRRFGPDNTSELQAAQRPLYAFASLLQTDVRVNLGCSGGALLDLDGNLIGLTTALAALTGGENPGGFAIPMDAPMRRIVEVLRRGEEVEYGFLGINMPRDMRPGIPVQIAGLVDGGPARESGLLPNDFIVAIDGRPVRDADDLVYLISVGLAGSEVKIEVARGSAGGRRQTISARLAKAPQTGTVVASNRPAARAGLRVDHASVVVAQTKSIPAGVAIREVVAGSPAERAHLQPNKVITLVNGQQVTSPAAFYKAMDAAGKKIELTIMEAPGMPQETIVLENKP